jgi:acetyl-CoA carboxylase biotin carboxyl carrier protein
MSNLDADLVRHALSLAEKHGFAEVEIAVGDDRFAGTLARRPSHQSSRTIESEPEAIIISSTVDVRASQVGYYRPPKHPIEVGSAISVGEVVAVISALGISNEIESPATGKVIELLVEPNQAVQFGQVLVRIEP